MRRKKLWHRVSLQDQVEIQQRLRGGEKHEAIVQAVGCSARSVRRFVQQTRNRPLRPWKRSTRQLSVQDREEIARGLLSGESLRGIARRMGRAASTVSREVRAMGGRQDYRAWRAEERAERCARRPKEFKLACHDTLRQEVEGGLARRWSPQQIAARLRLDFPNWPDMRICHETIYRSLFVQARGALRRELAAHLRTGRTHRVCRTRRQADARGRMLDMVMISARPAEVEDRAVPGHWEGDLIIGKSGQSAVATLVERSSRYVMVLPLLQGRTANHVREAIAKSIQWLPDHLRRSLTWDQGKEMAEHKRPCTGTSQLHRASSRRESSG